MCGLAGMRFPWKSKYLPPLPERTVLYSSLKTEFVLKSFPQQGRFIKYSTAFLVQHFRCQETTVILTKNYSERVFLWNSPLSFGQHQILAPDKKLILFPLELHGSIFAVWGYWCQASSKCSSYLYPSTVRFQTHSNIILFFRSAIKCGKMNWKAAHPSLQTILLFYN